MKYLIYLELIFACDLRQDYNALFFSKTINSLRKI